MHGAPAMLSQFCRLRVILLADLAALAILDGTLNSASNARRLLQPQNVQQLQLPTIIIGLFKVEQLLMLK